MRPMIREPVAALEQLDQNQPGDEPADVRPEGDASRLPAGDAGCATDDLQRDRAGSKDPAAGRR